MRNAKIILLFINKVQINETVLVFVFLCQNFIKVSKRSQKVMLPLRKSGYSGSSVVKGGG